MLNSLWSDLKIWSQNNINNLRILNKFYFLIYNFLMAKQIILNTEMIQV